MALYDTLHEISQQLDIINNKNLLMKKNSTKAENKCKFNLLFFSGRNFNARTRRKSRFRFPHQSESKQEGSFGKVFKNIQICRVRERSSLEPELPPPPISSFCSFANLIFVFMVIIISQL
jgi:hypothetical protein